MPIFDILNKEITELLELFNSTELNEETISEKIMTKAQAKRRKKRLAKKRAERKARQQAKEQEKQNQVTEEPKEVDAELVDNETSTGTALVVYQEVKNETAFSDYEEVTPEFQKLAETIQNLMQIYMEGIKKGMEMWKKAGEDKACPKEAWDLLNKTVEDFKNGIEQALNGVDLTALADPELILLDRFTESINGYIEKANKQIIAAKPDLSEEDFKAPATKDSTELSTDVKTNITKEVDAELVKDKEKKVDNKKQRNIVSYETFAKGIAPLNKTFVTLHDLLAPLVKGVAKTIASLALQPVSWISDKLFGFLTSPIAKDFIKTLMYSNPITAMIFDGKFGSFGITNVVDKVHNAAKKGLDKAKDNMNPFGSSKLDERKFPVDISKMTLRELKNNFYGNKALVDCINISFNHPDVNKKYKTAIKKDVDSFAKGLKNKDIKVCRNSFSRLLSTLRDVCDSMNWKTPKDWQVFSNLIGKIRKDRGLTDKEYAAIEKKAKEQEDAGDPVDKLFLGKIYTRLKDNKSNNWIEDFYSKEENGGYKHDEVMKYIGLAKEIIDKEAKSESYTDVKDLIQLCEEALA